VTAVTFGQVLVHAPEDDALTVDIKGKLDHHWGEALAKDIAAKSVFQLLDELAMVLPPADYNNDVRFKVAEAVKQLLTRLGFVAETQQPQRIKVEFDKRPGDMDLRELLTTLAAQPDAYARLRPHIEADEQVRLAAGKTKEWVITTSAGQLDIVETVKYVTQLGWPHAVAQRMISDGRRPTTLAKALGIDMRAMIHPFTGRPVHGPDENGFDLSGLSDELHEALLWATITRHPAWPLQIDLYTYTEEVLTSPLPRRWQRILDDYRHAKQADDSVRLISRYWPENLSLDDVIDLAAQMFDNGNPRDQRGHASSEQRVREAAALSGTLRVGGSGNSCTGGIYATLHVTGSGHSLDGIVIAEGGTITGSGNSGSLLLPPGIRVRVTGSGNDIYQRNLSWDDLAQRL
jgi:hypothetical protein